MVVLSLNDDILWPPWFPPPGPHTIVWSPPLECWEDLWPLLTNIIQQRWHNVCDYEYMIILHRILMSIWLREMLFLAGFEEESFHVVNCHMEKEQRIILSWQPTLNCVPQSGSLQWTESCKQPHELKSKSFPSQTSGKTSPRWHFDFSLMRHQAEDPAKLCPDSWRTKTVR